jgi:hypothetical protein
MSPDRVPGGRSSRFKFMVSDITLTDSKVGQLEAFLAVSWPLRRRRLASESVAVDHSVKFATERRKMEKQN